MEYTEDITVIDTDKDDFDMNLFLNRRFMYNPKLHLLVLGKDDDGSGSHSQEFADSNAAGQFDEYVRGWIGRGGDYPNGIIHFAPNIPKECVKYYDWAMDTLEMFSYNGMSPECIIRGFGAVWERSVSSTGLICHHNQKK